MLHPYTSVTVLSFQICFILWLATAAAAPQFLPASDQSFIQDVFSQDFSQDVGNQQLFTNNGQQSRILSQKFEQDPTGNYEYRYEQDNGQKVSFLRCRY